MSHKLSLKYGLNPDQKPAQLYLDKPGQDESASSLPLKVIQGNPGYINILDALNGWQLVRELAQVTGLAAATSFKHVSPAGAALGNPKEAADKGISPLALAYLKARASDRMSSFGDFIALSHTCDLDTAKIIEKEVSDGVVAPAFEPEALEIFKNKRKGSYLVLQIDPDYLPAPVESKQVFGLTLEQPRSQISIDSSLLENIVTENKELTQEAKLDLLLALVTAKYTQSNSVCYAYQGQTIGVGAGQQSRIHCTRLAGDKADIWHLRRHAKVLGLKFKESLRAPDRDNAIDVFISENHQEVTGPGQWEKFFLERPEPLSLSEKQEWLASIKGVSLASDGFFPFDDNIIRAGKSGVSYIAQPGGSVKDQEIIDKCNELGILMAFTGLRLFHH